MRAAEAYRARLATMLALAPRARVAPRAVVLVAAILGVVSVRVADGHPNALVAFAVAVFAVFAGARPDSSLGALVVVIVVVHWYVAVGRGALAWAVIPALCLLVVHAGLAALAVTPAPCFLPRRSLTRWAAHVGVVAAATVAVWLVSRNLGTVGGSAAEIARVAGFALLIAIALVLGQRALVRDP